MVFKIPNLITNLTNLLSHPINSIKKDACNLLLQLTMGNESRAEMLIKTPGFLTGIIELAKKKNFGVSNFWNSSII